MANNKKNKINPKNNPINNVEEDIVDSEEVVKDKPLNVFQNDIDGSRSFHDEHLKQISTWNKESDGKLYGNEVKNKAQVVDRTIRKAEIWQHAQVIDPFVSSPNMVKAIPITAEDEAQAEEDELILNYQWCRDFDRYNFVSNSYRVLQKEGTVMAKVSWNFKEEEIEVEVPIIKTIPMRDQAKGQAMIDQGLAPYEDVVIGTKKEMQIKTVVNKPDVELLNNAFTFVDPSVEGKAETGQFFGIEFTSNITKLREAGIYKNLDKIDVMIQEELDKSNSNYNSDQNDFKFSDKARREFKVTEYWGNYDIDDSGIAEPIVSTWVGGIEIRYSKSPMPFGDSPIVTCVVNQDPFSPYGKPNADVIGVDQKIQTGLKRSVLDTLNASTNGQKGIRKQALDPLNLKKFINGDDFEYNGDGVDIWTGEFNNIPSSMFNFSESIRMNSEGLTGVRSFASGSGSMGSATEARGALDAVAKKEVDESRNFKENFIVPILRKWMAMNAEFLESEQISRITNKPPVERRPGREAIDIDIQIETSETKTKRSQELSFMLQTMAQSLPFDLTKIMLAEHAELNNMPGLEEKIMAYEPQPDPIEQQMKMLEMKKLESEIAERESRTQENIVQIAYTKAKTANEHARARKGHGEADLNDQTFVDRGQGGPQDRERQKTIDDTEAKVFIEENKPSTSKTDSK